MIQPLPVSNSGPPPENTPESGVKRWVYFLRGKAVADVIRLRKLSSSCHLKFHLIRHKQPPYMYPPP